MPFYPCRGPLFFFCRFTAWKMSIVKPTKWPSICGKRIRTILIFERYFCRTAFVTGKMAEAEQAAQNIITKISQGMPGYEGVSGRNAAYVLAYYNMNYHRNYEAASSIIKKQSITPRKPFLECRVLVFPRY